MKPLVHKKAKRVRQKLVPMHANGTGWHDAPAACCTPGRIEICASASLKRRSARAAS